MFKFTDHSPNCEIRSLIRFFTARNVTAADIDLQIYEVYGTRRIEKKGVDASKLSTREVLMWLLLSFQYSPVVSFDGDKLVLFPSLVPAIIDFDR